MNFDEVWTRICEITGWRKSGQMADFLEIKSQSVSGAKSRGQFPIEWAFKIGQEYGLSTEWILTGKGIGGPGNTIDEDFFIRVAFAVESILKQRQLEISLWQKIRLYLFVYEQEMLNTGAINPEFVNKIVSLVATNATVVDEDSKIIALIEQLVANAPTGNEKIKLADTWMKKMSDKLHGSGVLATLVDKRAAVTWLESELHMQQNNSLQAGETAKADNDKPSIRQKVGRGSNNTQISGSNNTVTKK